jgi:hypothetical protein
MGGMKKVGTYLRSLGKMQMKKQKRIRKTGKSLLKKEIQI